MGTAKYESAGGDFSADNSGCIGCVFTGGKLGVSGLASRLILFLFRRLRLSNK